MKRYVFEFANDCKRLRGLPACYLDRIDRIIEVYKRGLITDFEAVREIVRTFAEGETV